MCTLYVLDWYNRTYVYTPHSFPRHPPTTPPVLMDNIVDLTNKEWAPPLQTLIPPLLSTCSLGGISCPVYCCANPASYNITDLEMAVDSFVALPKPTSPLEKRLPVGDKVDGLQMPFGNGVEIKLADLDLVLDERYCVEGSCNPSKGRYNLYIPVSAYMPTMSLKVKIT